MMTFEEGVYSLIILFSCIAVVVLTSKGNGDEDD